MVGTQAPKQPHDVSFKRESDWTYVQPRSRRGKPSTSVRRSAAAEEDSPHPKAHNLRPVSSIRAEYFKIRSQWEASQSCNALRHLIETNFCDFEEVTVAVCLGIGTFDPADGAWETKRNTLVQLIAFLVMVEQLEKFAGRRIECLFQEPLFTETDKAFLSDLGHTVVDSPIACQRVDPNTLLYAIHLYRRVYAMALETHQPAIFVGTGWDIWDSVMLPDEHNLGNLEKMERTYKKATFPQEGSGTAFSSTSVYWRLEPDVKD